MRLISASIRNPIAVGVVVLLICLFGGLSLMKLPLQLFPNIDRPNITVFTGWRAASPEETEAELLEPQEQVLQGLPGVEEIEGNANTGGSFINLTFAIGTDMKSALVDVIGRMNRVRSQPQDADRPVIQLAAAATTPTNRCRGSSCNCCPARKGRSKATGTTSRTSSNRASKRCPASPRSMSTQDRRTTYASRSTSPRPPRSVSAFPISHRRPRPPPTFPPAKSVLAVSNTPCASPAATSLAIWANSCSPGAMAGRSSSAMSPRSR